MNSILKGTASAIDHVKNLIISDMSVFTPYISEKYKSDTAVCIFDAYN